MRRVKSGKTNLVVYDQREFLRVNLNQPGFNLLFHFRHDFCFCYVSSQVNILGP